MIGAPYSVARAVYARLDLEAAAASRALRGIAGVGAGAMGLTPDSVKASPEYRRARLAYDSSAATLRDYAKTFMRQHGKQYRADLLREREARAAVNRASLAAE